MQSVIAARRPALRMPSARRSLVVRAQAKPQWREEAAKNLAVFAAVALVLTGAPEDALAAAKSSGRVGGSSFSARRAAPSTVVNNTTVVGGGAMAVAPPVVVAPVVSPFSVGFGFPMFMPMSFLPLNFMLAIFVGFLVIQIASNVLANKEREKDDF